MREEILKRLNRIEEALWTQLPIADVQNDVLRILIDVASLRLDVVRTVPGS